MKILLRVLCLLNFIVTLSVNAQTEKAATSGKQDEKIIYKYKQYQKFDFEDLVVEGEIGSPGDLSITPRFQKNFKNELPYRKNFNDKVKESIVRIR